MREKAHQGNHQSPTVSEYLRSGPTNQMGEKDDCSRWVISGGDGSLYSRVGAHDY